MNRNAESQSSTSVAALFLCLQAPDQLDRAMGLIEHAANAPWHSVAKKLLTMIASVLLRNSGFASKAIRARAVGLRALSSGPKSAAAPNSNIDTDNILPVRGDDDDDADWSLECTRLFLLLS
jgi:hypothetical protein